MELLSPRSFPSCEADPAYESGYEYAFRLSEHSQQSMLDRSAESSEHLQRRPEISIRLIILPNGVIPMQVLFESSVKKPYFTWLALAMNESGS